jgi:hypothetical protein
MTKKIIKKTIKNKSIKKKSIKKKSIKKKSSAKSTGGSDGSDGSESGGESTSGVALHRGWIAETVTGKGNGNSNSNGVPVARLTKAHLSVVYAAHPGPTRRGMDGVFIDPDGTCVATDGIVMATLRWLGLAWPGFVGRTLSRDDVIKLRTKLKNGEGAELVKVPDIFNERADPSGRCVSTPTERGNAGGGCVKKRCAKCFPGEVPAEVARVGSELITLRGVVAPFPSWREVLSDVERNSGDYDWCLETSTASLFKVCSTLKAALGSGNSDGAAVASWRLYQDGAVICGRHQSDATNTNLNLDLNVTLTVGNPKGDALGHVKLNAERTLALLRVAKGAGIDRIALGVQSGHRSEVSPMVIHGSVACGDTFGADSLALFALQMPCT